MDGEDDYLAPNTHRDGQETLNNEKSVYQSSPSPVEVNYDNPISHRSGGPCSPDGGDLGTCGHCHPDCRIDYTCNCFIRVCSSCKRNGYDNCRDHPECGRKN
jgi:hypothetical protein